MDSGSDSVERIIQSLAERAKELNCLYRIDEILDRRDRDEEAVLRQAVEVIPAGWQYPEICEARIVVGDQACCTSGYREDRPALVARIEAEDGPPLGSVSVCYTRPSPEFDEGPFLKEERRLVNAIAQRLGLFIMQSRLRRVHDELVRATQANGQGHRSWEVLLDFVQHTDPDLLGRITRKMINHLCWNGDVEASTLVEATGAWKPDGLDEPADDNRPLRRSEIMPRDEFTRRTFQLAEHHLSESEIVECIQAWINEDKCRLLTQTLENSDCGLAEITDALKRFKASGVCEEDLPPAVRTTLRVGLIRRYFTEQRDFIDVAKDYLSIEDLCGVTDRLIIPSRSHGKLGGKGAGLMLASRVLQESEQDHQLFSSLRVPKTWFIASDGLISFIHHNNLEEVYNRKYMEIERVRQDYPLVIQVFKNSNFPPEIVAGLSAVLDEFGERPIIVRSSSLLEDRFGASFAGKYKSLFLANQGSKSERLAALQDAIAEIYASVFGPDPIEYRAERDLLHFNEEMGILIQEVVGQRVGQWYAPAFAGVAFSSNEFRWSPRIRREDGLLRIVPGLGTRAVDRIGDDYPVLIAPGQPSLRVNASPDEIVRYAPARADVIDLEANELATVDIARLLRETDGAYPAARRLISMVEPDHVRPPAGLEPDWQTDVFVVTLEGMLAKTPFLGQMHRMLTLLRDGLGTNVDIEFAHDGECLYLLQCRSQSCTQDFAPSPIPQDVPDEHLVFSAHRHISSGFVPDLSHLVYVDPEGYSALPDLRQLRAVAQAVGRLNAILPKRQFALFGPGRWGSRGDLKLGVSVTYSDINNCALLVEIARASGSYTPELSFGTHFFQDMVESGIRYLPLYPDEDGNDFNEPFFRCVQNMLPNLLPEYAGLRDVLRVIDVAQETQGRALRVLMNAELQQAVGILVPPSSDRAPEPVPQWNSPEHPDEHWRWRLRMAERVASRLDADAFGVKGVYLIGSVKNATAGPGSDIDLLIHDRGDQEQRERLRLWLDGWSQTLTEVNFLRTGYESEGLLDVHFVTDDDIAAQTSFAVKINAVTDAARPLPLREKHAP